MLLGYARVSKADNQDTAAQVSALKAAGCTRVYEETASGGRWDWPELHRLLDHLRDGDALVVWKLDRLSRSLKDLLHILEKIDAAGATFRSLTEAVDTTGPAHGLGAMLCMYDENVRYLTGTLTPGWNRLKPGLRYAMLCGDDPPVLFEQGDLGFQIERHSPWIPKENVRWSYAWIKGAAGPASTPAGRQVHQGGPRADEEERRRAGMKLGVDFIDINMIQAFKDAKIDWVDGMSPMMEARAVKNVDEQECLRIVGAIGDAAHWETMRFLRPGVTENQVTAHIMQFLYSIPGHGGRRGRHRLVGAEHVAELAQLLRPHHPARRHRLHGSRGAHVERLQVVLLPHLLRRQGAEPTSRRRSTPRRSSGSTTRSAR